MSIIRVFNIVSLVFVCIGFLLSLSLIGDLKKENLTIKEENRELKKEGDSLSSELFYCKHPDQKP